MKAYFDSIEKEVPEALREVFLDRHDTAVITIDMHDGHLSTDPDCPCPSPRGREIIEPLNHFMDEARALGLPVIHVRSTLRRDGADEKLFPSAWRMVFPVTVGEIPNIAEHALEGTRWNRMSIDVYDEDYMVTTKKRLSAFYPTDLELLLRNLGIRRVHDRLLRHQYRVRRREPRFPRGRAARSDPRLRASGGAGAARDLAASGTGRGFGGAARRMALAEGMKR